MVKNTNKKSDFTKYLDNKMIGNITLRDFLIKISFYLALVIIIPLLFPSGRSFKYTDLRVGSIINKKVIAPFNFPVLKTEQELKIDREKAVSEVPFYFIYSDSVFPVQIEKFTHFFDYIGSLPREIKLTTLAESDTSDSLSMNEVVSTLSVDYDATMSVEEISQLLTLLHETNKENLKRSLITQLNNLYDKNYVDVNKSEIKGRNLVLIRSGIEEELQSTDLLDAQEWTAYLESIYTSAKDKDTILKILTLFAEPNIIYNRDYTEEQSREAVAQVSTGKDYVYENERIVDANERITEDIYQKLYSLEVATAERSIQSGDLRSFFSTLAKYLLTALILFMFVFYLPANRPLIFRDNKKLLLLTILILIQVAIGAFIVNTLGWSSYLIPTTISSMLLGILFDAGMGFISTVIIGLLLGGITGFDYSFILMTIFVGVVSIYSVTHIRTRNHIFRAILHIVLAYTIVVIVFGFLHYENFDEISQVLLYYILPNAILSPFITYMILGIFERIFDITTDITLLELSDLNHPLLKELAVKAPGTFHHSIVVGNLAEAAAKVIGGNSLLARVGSYYHDIGKMEKPEYFVENEQGGENKHKSLAPNMSAIILSSHVKVGLEMAEENNLPKIIRDFIPEHHGRNLMSFFHNKAAQTQDEKDINIDDYRYPGPSPQSKETAIVMLADTVEAATKTLKNPTAGRLRKMVEELVEKRFLEGELDESDLTMRDLKGIIDGFMSVLSGIYHKRIEYPGGDDSIKSSSKKEQKVKVKSNGSSN
jgi:putative nucleotidyltransferase with HDIG domain